MYTNNAMHVQTSTPLLSKRKENVYFIMILVCVSVFLLLLFLLRGIFSLNCCFLISSQRLPPGPQTLSILVTLRGLRFGLAGVEPYLRSLHCRFGPIISVPFFIGHTAISIADHSLTYEALVKNGTVFADRPPPHATSNKYNVNTALYGPTWRLLRSNLSSGVLNPTRVRSYSSLRRWVLKILMGSLRVSQGKEPIGVVDHLHHAIFCLLAVMCFGDNIDEKQILQVEHIQERLVRNFARFIILNLPIKITKILFQKRWKEFFQIQKQQESVFLPLIRARRKINEQTIVSAWAVDNQDYKLSYVDTLLHLEHPNKGKRRLSEGEMVGLCSEFLSAGVDTMTTALQWIMANLVKYPNIQEKLHAQIKEVVGSREEIQEEDLQKMPYLKAVILEGLRRHPPTHISIPHRVTDDTVLGDYYIKKNSIVNFMVADIGWDPQVWEDPMTFKPERFTAPVMMKKGKELDDITGSSRGIIKMIPFGAGRRICPGLGLAMLHLQYYVANMVWEFEWKKVEGDDVDISEKQEFTVVMKHPLKAHAVPRRTEQMEA